MKSRKLITILLLCAIFSCNLKSGIPNSFAGQTNPEQTEDTKTYPETVRWFTSTYAILTLRNGADLFVPGGGTPDEVFYPAVLKGVLARDWNVTDRRSAQDEITWLENGGHNQSLLQYYNEHNLGQYKTDADLNASWDSGSGEISTAEAMRQMCAYMAYKTYGDNAIAAWDLSRALMLLGDYYVVGYYTYEEAMDKSLEIGRKLQAMYSSWDDFVQSYMYGYGYWSKSDPTDPSSEFTYRASLYQYLKSMENGPYQIDWNLELKKEW